MDTKARMVRERLIAVAQHRDTIFYSDVARLADLHVRSKPSFSSSTRSAHTSTKRADRC